MTKPEWEVYAQKTQYPSDWKIALSPHATGPCAMAFDPKTGYGLRVQPLYRDDKSAPEMLVVGSYFPGGTLPRFTETLMKEIEEEAKKELGSNYSVTARYAKMPPLEGIELTVMRLQE